MINYIVGLFEAGLSAVLLDMYITKGGTEVLALVFLTAWFSLSHLIKEVMNDRKQK